MLQAPLPAPASASDAPASPSSAAAPSESVERPPPGLARGKWEAPPWAFVLVAALTVVGSAVWLLLFLRARRSGS